MKAGNLIGALAAAVLVPALAAPAAQAVTRYAAPDGVTDGSCTTVETACEINRAVEALGSTTEVVLLPGTYDLGADPGTSEIAVPPGAHVHGAAGAERPVVSGAGAINSPFRLVQGGSRLSDVAVVKSGGGGAAIFAADGTATAERVTAVSLVAGSFACGLVRGLIRDTVCLSTGEHGMGLGQNQNGAGSYAGRLRNVTALATGPGNSRAIVWEAGNVPGITMTLDAKSVIASGTAADVRAGSTNAGSSTSVTLQNSNYSTVSTTATAPGLVTPAGENGNQIAEPILVNPAGGDFSQHPESPTIDAGIADADTGTADIGGDPRILHASPDIGADEYRVAAPSLTGTSPASPGSSNTPAILGQATVVHPTATTVAIYTNASCAGTPVATSEAGAFNAAGAVVNVPDNSTTSFWALVGDGYGRDSACSSTSVTYSEVTSPPPPPPGTGPGEDAAPLPKAKKCKKAKKGKAKGKRTKRKCKKAKKGNLG